MIELCEQLDLPSLAKWVAKNRDTLTPQEKTSVCKAIEAKQRGYRTNPILQAIRPHVHEKQRKFLSLNVTEALFGGAGGGGKSDALLMAALQYVDVPGYSCIIFRKSYPDLAGEGAIMDRCRKWLRQFEGKGVHWSEKKGYGYFFDTEWQPSQIAFKRRRLREAGDDREYTDDEIRSLLGDPPQARLAFSYLDSDDDRYRYQGWEFQCVIFDELTQHPEQNYTYLFSRLRRLEGVDIPLRMRAATNPGGRYGDWVKERFVPNEYLAADKDIQFSNVWRKVMGCDECGGTGQLDIAKLFGEKPTGTDGATADGSTLEPCFYCDGKGECDRHFIPARLIDNPSLDRKAYLKSLRELTPIDRARMEHGRWDIMDIGGFFQEQWFRYWSRQGEAGHYILHTGPDTPEIRVPNEHIQFFLTADTASKIKTWNDYTVIATWALDTLNYNLLLVHAFRKKLLVPDILPAILNLYHRINAAFIMIEDASSGIGVIQEANTARGKGITVKAFNPQAKGRKDSDKVSRATVAQIRMEAGKVYFPQGNPSWLGEYVAELLGFDGDPDKNDDCVDTLTMACMHAAGLDNVRKRAASKPQQLRGGPVRYGV